MRVDRLIVGGDAGDAERCDVDALVADTGEGVGHVDQPHVRCAQHHRRMGVDRGGDAEPPRHVGDGLEPHRLPQLRRDRVERIGEGGAQRDLARIAARIVARRPAVDRHRLVDLPVLWRAPGFQRGEIDEQLERRSRLALRLGGAVVDRADVIGPAHHRAHRAVAVDRHQRALCALGHVGADRGIRLALHRGVQRGPHLQRLDRLVDQQVQLRQRPVGEIAHAVLPRGGGELHLARIGAGGLRLRDEAVAHHLLQHDACPPLGGIGVGGRGIIGRRLDQPGDHRRLGQAQPVGTMAEEFPAGRVDAVCAPAIIDLVQIQLEDLVLVELALQREREDPFAKLAPEFLLIVQEDVARQLLRDGRPALHPAAAFDADHHRSRYADRVDAQVAAEPPVLDRDRRVAHHRGDAIIRQPFTIARPQRHQHRSVGGMNADHLPVGGGFEAFETGQLRSRDEHGGRQRPQPQHRQERGYLDRQHQPAAPCRRGGGTGCGGTGAGHVVALGG